MDRLGESGLKDLERRFNRLRDELQRFMGQIIDAVYLCAPNANALNVLYSYSDSGINITRQIHNSTPLEINRSRANELHSLLAPVQKQWGWFVEIDPNSGQIIPNSPNAEMVTNAVFNAINESNLHDIFASVMIDVNIGTAGLKVDYKNGKFSFTQLAGITIMPEINFHKDKIVFWRRVLTKQDFESEFPTEASRQASKNNKEGQELYYVDACSYRDDNNCYYDVVALDGEFSKPLKNEKRPCVETVVINDIVRAGEGRGRGVILNNLSDIDYLNEQTKNLKKWASYACNPALLTNTNLPDNILEMKGRSISMDMNSERAINKMAHVQPIEYEIPYQAMYEAQLALEAKLERRFRVMPLGDVTQTPRMTATEADLRNAENQRQIFADLARFAQQALGGIFDCVYEKLVIEKVIKTPLKNYRHQFLFVQETLDAADKLNRWLQYAQISQQTNGQLSVSMFNNASKVDKYIKRLTNVPESVSNSEQEVKQFIKGVQQQNEQNQPTPVQPQQGQQPTNIGTTRTLGN